MESTIQAGLSGFLSGQTATSRFDPYHFHQHFKLKTKEKMDKPYIKLDQDYPGIVSLFMYDKDAAKALSAMGQTIMRRRPRGLSVAQRELIASFVSKLNDCNFCSESHGACAKQFIGSALVDAVVKDCNVEFLPIRMRGLLLVAEAVQALDRERIPLAIEKAKNAGATDEQIHDTVLVTAFFCMCNRYVDGLGTTYKPGEPEDGGRSLARYGYTMTIRRFFSEILPKMWTQFWNR